MAVMVMMGIAGAGKTTVGQALAAERRVPFLEGDDCHPAANVAKMRAGVPLDDGDRAPWLGTIAEWIALHASIGGVVSCSALKRDYRDRLRAACDGCVRFVLLDIGADVARVRIASRTHHFMPATLVDSQIAALERPQDEADMCVVDAAQSVDAILGAVQRWLEESSTPR